MSIRSAWIADCEVIRNLLEQLGYPHSTEIIKEKLDKLISNPDDEVFVYHENNKVLGFITAHFSVQLAFSGDFCEIGYLVVDESARSKGIGKKLEEYVCDIAKNRGCSRIHVFSMSYRTEAHRFYEKLGYSEIQKFFEKVLE
ncbi:GNAT family N-acetyltransferase [Dysgonomonas sp. OttesenSCG-928-M03]|nr:GNAT family N-acetyltransferase [Dysgonomonas sp. OttesenSCG-928-M03]